MAELLFFSGGINGESNVLDLCPEFGVYASGCNLVRFEPLNDPKAIPFDDSHEAQIHSVSISVFNGEQGIVTASSDKSIKIWNKTDLLKTVLHEHGVLYAKAFGNKLVAYDDQGNVLVYGTDLTLAQKISFSPKRVHSLDLSPEGILAVGTSDKFIRIFSEQDGIFVPKLSLPGHVNWVTSLEWSPLTKEGVRFLASAGPDKTVRLWKLARKESVKSSAKLTELVPKKNSFKLQDGVEYVIDNEAILYGHEGMVNSCRWSLDNKDGDSIASLRLVSASVDHTLIIWGPGESMWSSMAHFGDISGSGSVGGDRTFGFFSGLLMGDRITSHSSNGGIQFWKRVESESLYAQWQPQTPLTGHFKSVEGCTWSTDHRFLLTTSLDQTTRAFARNSRDEWHELSRPQIHGYDLQCISMIDDRTFMSGADEKVIRVFSMPESLDIRYKAFTGEEIPEAASVRPTMVPALGLSNKSYGDDDSSPVTAEVALNQPPTESDLCRHTLWPEIDKLYGHGYELYSLAVNSTADLAASSARANLSADAGIRFWMKASAESTSVHWVAVPNGHITGHTLTIVSLQFSPSGKYLLATSRDRSWSIIQIDKDNAGQYAFRMIQRVEGHSRIIWAGAWDSDSSFVTGSRDKTLKRWTLDESKSQFVLSSTIQVGSGCTALHVFPNTGLMAAGEETGNLTIFKRSDAGIWEKLVSFKAASDAINDLKWCLGSECHPELAVVSKDRSLRVFRVDMI